MRGIFGAWEWGRRVPGWRALSMFDGRPVGGWGGRGGFEFAQIRRFRRALLNFYLLPEGERPRAATQNAFSSRMHSAYTVCILSYAFGRFERIHSVKLD